MTIFDRFNDRRQDAGQDVGRRAGHRSLSLSRAHRAAGGHRGGPRRGLRPAHARAAPPHCSTQARAGPACRPSAPRPTALAATRERSPAWPPAPRCASRAPSSARGRACGAGRRRGAWSAAACSRRSLLGSIAGSVIGTAIAQQLLPHDPDAASLFERRGSRGRGLSPAGCLHDDDRRAGLRHTGGRLAASIRRPRRAACDAAIPSIPDAPPPQAPRRRRPNRRPG